ncbi:MAG: DUF4956 domain-containing protein [Oscillospiraceae bacterium]|jgi:hypothetical protein|nr:DUF4956 domain-containing protein [Oscillospiraceae bacterium]
MLTLATAVAVGLFIFFIYKLAYKGVVYSHSFNVSLIMVCIITSVIVLAVSANIALTFGMIGALSIVRFRTAIKDPVDVVFLFWAITSGIVAGTGEVLFLAVASLALGTVAVIMFSVRSSKNTFLLIIEVKPDCADALHKSLKESLSITMKSKSLVRDRAELVYEMRLRANADTSFLEELNKRDEIRSAVLVGYNGDYAE